MVNAQISDDASLQSTDILINNVKEKLQDDFDNKVGELTLEELQIAAEQIEVSDDTLLTWEELKQKIQEIKDETTIAALANKDYSDSFKKIKETANEVLKNKQIFNGAIEKTKNGENLDYDTVSALIELDPSLADKFIKTADGYRIAVDALIAANEKYVQSKGADSLKSKIEEANTEITKDRKAELAVLYTNIKMLWRSLRAFKISIPNSNQILPESEKNTIPAKV